MKLFLLAAIASVLTGCTLPKTDPSPYAGQGRNYIYFDCKVDTAKADTVIWK